MGPAFPGSMKMWAVGSEGPKTLPPLKLKRARPSQKLSKLKAAPWNVGVWRGSIRRTPCMIGMGSGIGVPTSGRSGLTPMNAGPNPALPTRTSSKRVKRLTPIEDMTSLASLTPSANPSPTMSGFARLWKGKSLAITSTLDVGEPATLMTS